MKIKFEGPITVIQQDENGENETVITSSEQLANLDGMTHDSELSDYLFDGVGTENLKELGITGGIISLRYKNNRVFLNINYDLKKEPSEEQIKTLWQDIMGQLTDGAGPIFSGDCEDQTGLSPLMEPESIEVYLYEGT